jgi:hypothetical protein
VTTRKRGSHPARTVGDKSFYADVNETPAPKRAVHERFSDKYRVAVGATGKKLAYPDLVEIAVDVLQSLLKGKARTVTSITSGSAGRTNIDEFACLTVGYSFARLSCISIVSCHQQVQT